MTDVRADEVVVRPIASPLPLGFLGLAVGTVLLAALQLGWVPVDQGSVIAWGLFAFTVPLQGMAAVVGLLARDVGVGTGMGVLSGSWATVALATLLRPPGSTSAALGVLLVTAATALAVPAAVAWSSKPLAGAVLTLAVVRLMISGAVQLGAGDTWETVAGVVGVALGGLAVYAALAYALEDAQERAVLPTGRRAPRAEAGVRRPL